MMSAPIEIPDTTATVFANSPRRRYAVHLELVVEADDTVTAIERVVDNLDRRRLAVTELTLDDATPGALQ